VDDDRDGCGGGGNNPALEATPLRMAADLGNGIDAPLIQRLLVSFWSYSHSYTA
jgi:hypothetical protein